MELNEAMRTTFSAREYTGEALSDETLHEILESARFAPSGGNRQGNRVIVVRKQDTKERGRGMGPVKRISHVEARPHKVLSFCW